MGHRKWTRYLYNVASFMADLLRSLAKAQMGKTSDSHILLLLFLIQENLCVENGSTSGSRLVLGSYRVSAHFNSILTVCPSCHRDWALPGFEVPSSPQS